MKKKAERLHHIARVCKLFVYCGGEYTHYLALFGLCFTALYHPQIIKDKAESRLKSVANKHWSDGALEVTYFDVYLVVVASMTRNCVYVD